MRNLRALAISLLFVLAAGAGAADPAGSRVPAPAYRITAAGQCVEPTAEMRRGHMNMLLHQRDQTMRSGIRTVRHSLKNCVDCHADPVTNSVLGKEGFCESCHAYAAVRIDCFECHSPLRRAAAAVPVAVGRMDGKSQ